jgi:hypothetical protein
MIYMVLLFIWRFIYKKRLEEEENLVCLGNRDIFASLDFIFRFDHRFEYHHYFG